MEASVKKSSWRRISNTHAKQRKRPSEALKPANHVKLCDADLMRAAGACRQEASKRRRRILGGGRRQENRLPCMHRRIAEKINASDI
ncbi:MAG: hypothetical protein QM808_01255 [Steroidobacteraceae bacterium]